MDWLARCASSLIVAAGFVGASAAAQTPAPVARVVVDPAARMLDGGGAGEAWDVSASFAGGAHFFVRFWVTNEGPGAHTAVAMGYFVRPGGEVTTFRYGRDRDRWELGAGGRFLRVASAVLDLRPPSGSVEIDTDKGGMKVYVRFAMPQSPQPLCARRDGDAGFDVLRLQADTDGIAWVEGMAAPMAANGTIDVTHAWGAESEIDTMLRRIDASGRDGEVAFFATSVVAPSDRERATSCVAVVDDGEKVFEAGNAAAEIAATVLAGTDDRHPLPSQLAFRAEGLELAIEPQRELLRINPLDIVPQPFRMLLGLRSTPRRAWAESRWRLRTTPTERGSTLEKSGRGIVSVSYTNPW